MITSAQLASITDDVANFYLRAKGTAPTYGLGNVADVDRCRLALSNLEAHVLATGDLGIVGQLSSAITSAKANTTATAVTALAFTEMMRRLETIIASYQIPNAVTFDGFVTYLNTHGAPYTYWEAVLHPIWAELWPLFRFGATLSPSTMYQMANLATWTPGGGFVAGSTIDHTIYSGGQCEIDVVGHAGNFDVVVTGVGFDPATKGIIAGSTWTKNAVAGNGVHVLTSAQNRQIVQATAINVTGTNPTSIAIRADAPTGRPVLP